MKVLHESKKKVKKLRGGVRAREANTVKFTGNFRIVEEIPSQKKWNVLHAEGRSLWPASMLSVASPLHAASPLPE